MHGDVQGFDFTAEIWLHTIAGVDNATVLSDLGA